MITPAVNFPVSESLSQASVLCIDDDPVVQILLKEVVETAGAGYHGATTVREAETLLEEQLFNLILLDRRLPDGDGLLLIQTVRETCDCSVIVLSELNEAHDRLLGLGLGATEYVAKPFSPAELSSRIRFILLDRFLKNKRTEARPKSIGQLTFDPLSRNLTIGDETIFLPPAEARLLHLFLENADRVLNRDDLTQHACGRDWSPGDRTVDVLISRLRRRLKTSGVSIVTVHRAGYVLTTGGD